MKKEGLMRHFPLAAVVVTGALAAETLRETATLVPVNDSAELTRCIDQKNIYKPVEYQPARIECLAQVGPNEFTPVLDTLSFLLEPQGRRD